MNGVDMKSIARNLVLMFLVVLLAVGHVTLVSGCKEKGAGRTGELTEEIEESWDDAAEETAGDTNEGTEEPTDELSERVDESF